MLHIVLEHDPAVEDQRIIDEGFLTAQADRVGDPDLDVFACFLRDERRQIHGGLLGRLWWRWLYVERLWLAPARAVEATDAACWNGRKLTPGKPVARPPSSIPSTRRPWPSTGAAATK